MTGTTPSQPDDIVYLDTIGPAYWPGSLRANRLFVRIQFSACVSTGFVMPGANNEGTVNTQTLIDNPLLYWNVSSCGNASNSSTAAPCSTLSSKFLQNNQWWVDRWAFAAENIDGVPPLMGRRAKYNSPPPRPPPRPPPPRPPAPLPPYPYRGPNPPSPPGSLDSPLNYAERCDISLINVSGLFLRDDSPEAARRPFILYLNMSYSELMARPADAENGISAFKNELRDAMSVAFQVMRVNAGSRAGGGSSSAFIGT